MFSLLPVQSVSISILVRKILASWSMIQYLTCQAGILQDKLVPCRLSSSLFWNIKGIFANSQRTKKTVPTFTENALLVNGQNFVLMNLSLHAKTVLLQMNCREIRSTILLVFRLLTTSSSYPNSTNLSFSDLKEHFKALNERRIQLFRSLN